MTSPLERAARALGDTPDLAGATLRKALIAVGSPDNGEQTLRHLARAVIEAIREPSETMVDASRAEEGCGCPCCVGADDWSTMIDALLAEGA